MVHMERRFLIRKAFLKLHGRHQFLEQNTSVSSPKKYSRHVQANSASRHRRTKGKQYISLNGYWPRNATTIHAGIVWWSAATFRNVQRTARAFRAVTLGVSPLCCWIRGRFLRLVHHSFRRKNKLLLRRGYWRKTRWASNSLSIWNERMNLRRSTASPTTHEALRQTQTMEESTTKSRPTNATKATTLTTVELPPSKPSIGLTCICEDSTKLSMAAYDDMCSRLYVRLSYDKYGLLIDVPDTIRDIIELHPKKVGVAASFRGVENEMTLFESLKKEDAWLAVGCGLLEVPFRKVFATHLIKNFLAIVSKKVPPEMVMISIEPDDYISRLAENIESSKLAGVSIIVVTPRKGDFSCPTEGLWKQKEMLDCAIMLNKNLTQPVSIATTAAVAELKFASGKRDVCKSVTKVTTEVTGCSGKFKQRKFMCGSKIYYAESDVTLSEMASYAKKYGLNCALLDTEMGQLSAKYIRRSMFNLNCNTTSKSKHNEVYDDDDGT